MAIDKRTRNLLAAALVFTALAYAPGFASQRRVGFLGLMVFWSFFCSTFIVLCDETTRLLDDRSLLNDILRSGRGFLHFLAVGAVCGVMLDGVAQWLGKLWIYPFWNKAVYGSTFVVGFCAYWLTLAESYLAAKAVLKRLLPRARAAARPAPARRAGYGLYGAAGLALAFAGIALALEDYRVAGGYTFQLARRSAVKVHFAWFLITFIGFWLLLEFAQRRQGKVSLLTALAEGNRLPLYSILAASAVLSVLMETVNAAHHFWIYTNWPWERAWIFGVPLAVLLTWPLQYVVFLSVYHAVPSGESRNPWE